MDLISSILLSILLAIGFMSGVFVIGKRMKRYDVVDMAWGLVFIVIALGVLMYYGFVHGGDIHWGKLLITSLIAIWGARLATHIGHRLQRTTQEDHRYVELRAKWRGNIERNIFFRIFMVQALLATVIALPVIFVNASTMIVVPAFLLAGAVVWLIGFVFESVADLQLESFITQKKGELMTEGLWKYSRHPNYFGEMTQWWGIGIMALSVDYGWFSLLGPLVLTFLLLFVSGVPLAEKGSEKRAGWKDYKRRTSVVIPLHPIKYDIYLSQQMRYYCIKTFEWLSPTSCKKKSKESRPCRYRHDRSNN